jgi:KDO2-lipid IV(A) lauroyltransferase
MFNVGVGLGRQLPLGASRALGAWAGRLYASTHARRVEIVHRNLRLIDPSFTVKLAQHVYSEFGKTLADYFYIGTRAPEQAAQIITQIDGLEHLQSAQAAGKGALIVTAHFGLFELGGLLLAQHGFSSTVLTYPEPSPALTAWRATFRKRWNVDTLEIGADDFAFLQISERLRQGQFIATLIDRPHPTDKTTVTLPNGKAQFSAGILLLAAHGGVPVIPATMVRRKNGSYHAQVFAPLFIEERGSRAETLAYYSQRIADKFVPVLAAYPDQWYQFVPLAPAA